jgi:hypothetical protein
MKLAPTIIREEFIEVYVYEKRQGKENIEAIGDIGNKL